MANVLEGTEAWTMLGERREGVSYILGGFVWEGGEGEMWVPFGAAKWITFPSSLNMFTSSMAWMGWTFSFLREVWSFLSSVPDVLWTFFTFRRGVPLPLGWRG